jgi:hypothetical protein
MVTFVLDKWQTVRVMRGLQNPAYKLAAFFFFEATPSPSEGGVMD